MRRKLKEFHDAIGDEGGAEEAERQRGKVMRLLLELGYKEEAVPLPPPTTEGGPPEGPAANGRAGDAGEEEADPFNLDALGDTAAPLLPAEARQPDTAAITAENGGALKRYMCFPFYDLLSIRADTKSTLPSVRSHGVHTAPRCK